MAQLAIKGHTTRGKEVIEILEMLGGKNKEGYCGNNPNVAYYISHNNNTILCDCVHYIYNFVDYTIEEFLEKFPYKVGDKVKNTRINDFIGKIINAQWDSNEKQIIYIVEWDDVAKSTLSYFARGLQPYKEETMENKGNISDGYHTFNELYEYRLLYNASMFNELAKQGLYDVHKSKRHSDGTIPFGDENWFIVQAELPTGQISNHYEMKDWELFNVPEKEKANHYDGHTPQDVAKRLRNFLSPNPQYPKTYEECCKIVNANPHIRLKYDLSDEQKYSYDIDKLQHYENIRKLLICRDAYWKIAGEQMGLGKPWTPDWNHYAEKYVIYQFLHLYFIDKEHYRNTILAFPTPEMRDAFYENFKYLIEKCQEL